MSWIWPLPEAYSEHGAFLSTCQDTWKKSGILYWFRLWPQEGTDTALQPEVFDAE